MLELCLIVWQFGAIVNLSPLLLFSKTRNWYHRKCTAEYSVIQHYINTKFDCITAWKWEHYFNNFLVAVDMFWKWVFNLKWKLSHKVNSTSFWKTPLFSIEIVDADSVLKMRSSLHFISSEIIWKRTQYVWSVKVLQTMMG